MASNEPPTRGDVSVAVQFDKIAVSWSAENVSWAPDVAKDMQNRTMEMFKEALRELVEYGLITESEVVFDTGEDVDE